MSDHSLAAQWIVRGWSTNRIVALYALIGSAWILLSDRLFIFSAPDQNMAALFSTVKGLGYVAATAWLLYGLINRYTAELRASEERFRIIFEHANDAIHIDTADDNILDVNPRMSELMGYSRDELLTMRISDLQAPERRTASRIVATEQAQHGDALFEGLNLHRDGRRIPVEISVARVARPHGDLYVSVIRDITERKRADEALRASESLLRAIVDNIPLEFWARDCDGRCFMENAELVKHWGSLLGTRIEDTAAAPEDLTVWQVNNARAFAGEVVNEETAFMIQGERRQFQNIVAPIRQGDGIRGILGLNIDITDRKRAEEALRQSQAFNQAVIDHSPLGISARNRTGQLLFANAAWRKIWAISESDVQDDVKRERDKLQFNARDDYLKPYQADLRRVYEQGGYLHLPELKTTHPRPGGAEWVSQHFYAITDEQGQVDRVVIMTEDVSDRKRAENALRESEAKFRAIVETSNDGILFGDADARITYRSPSYQRINGYSAEEHVGQTGFETVHPNDLDLVRQYWAEVLQEPDVTHKAEYRIRHKDGAWRWIETSGRNLLSNPHVQAVVVASRDITDRKQRERELEAIAAIAMALRAASTRAEMLPVIVQQTADLLTADGAALILRDPATDQSVIALGLGVSADSTGLHVPRGAGIVGHVMTTSQPYLTQDVEHDPLTFRPDLAHGVRAVACTPLIAQDRILGALWAGRTTAITEEETRLLAAIADIAANALHRAEVLETLEQRVYDRTRELAAANERLQELDRLKSKFVSDVSHELRTPITSLMLNVELLEHGKPEKREQYLSIIRQQTTRQVQLIEDILNLSRLELSATRTQFAPVKVNALIDQAVNVYRSSAEAANLRLIFTPAPAEPVVMGVESHLSQVVTNLIANAIAYTPAGSVEVSTRIADHEVVIEVRDTGLGVAPEDMPHLFDRFYRGKLTWQVRGSGLGLAIVKEITEVHKGRVEVDSQAGVGSTFRVYLPVV